MGKGIVGKIWNIKAGSKSRGVSKQIADTIAYITNSEKCDRKLNDSSVSIIGKELNYITNDVKTLEGLYVGSRHIFSIDNAMNEMMQVKEFFGKTDGRIALHGVVSLDESESDEKNAGKLMLLLNDFLQEIFPENQAVYAVHTNTENLHVHFVVNTVGLDGKKIHMDNKFMSEIFDNNLNKLAVKYGFTPNEDWIKKNKTDTISIVERKIELRKYIDKAIIESNDISDFITKLESYGVSTRVGKHLSVRVQGMTRNMRSYQLGSDYTLEAIAERIKRKWMELEENTVGNYAEGILKSEIMHYEPLKIKKYKDMTPEEKKETVHMLRLGRNPWQESYKQNWQLQKMSDDLNREAYVYRIIRSGGKSEIINKQKALSTEKKAIKENLKKNRDVINLYKETKKYAARAYLFDICGIPEYKDDYVKYKESILCLKNNFNKTIEEVAYWMEEQNNQLLYIQAQSRELSEEYKILQNYEYNHKNNKINCGRNIL